jgi:hypothetical protein
MLYLYKNVKGFDDGMSSFFDAVEKRCAPAPGTATDAVGDESEDPCRLFILFQVLVSHFAVILRSQGKNEATHRSRVDAIIEDVFVVDKCYEIEYVRFHSILSHLNLCYAYMHDAEICVHRSSTLHVTLLFSTPSKIRPSVDRSQVRSYAGSSGSAILRQGSSHTFPLLSSTSLPLHKSTASASWCLT